MELNPEYYFNLLRSELCPGGSSGRSLGKNKVSTLRTVPLNLKKILYGNTRYAGGSDTPGFSPNQVDTLKRENAFIKKKFKELEEGIEAYESYIMWQENEIKRLSFHLRSVSSDLNKREQQQKVRTLTTKAFNVDNTVSLQNRINELETKLAEKENEHQVLLQRLDEEITEREKVKEASKIIAKQYVVLTNQSPQVRENDQDARNEDDDKIQQLEDEKELLLEELEACEKYISNQVVEMKKLAFYIDYLSKDVKKFQKTTQTDGSKRSKKDSNFWKRIMKLQAQVNKFKAKLATKEENNRFLKEQIDNERQAKKKVEDAFFKVSKIYDDLVRETYHAESIKCECERYRKQLKKYEMMAQRVDELEKEKNDYVATLEDYRQHLHDQDKKINNLLSNMDANHQKMDQLRDVIANMRNHIAEYEHKHKQYSEEKLCMCNHIEELKTQIEDLESELVLRDENNKVLLGKLDQKKKDKAKLKAKLEEVTRSNHNVREMMAQARQTINSVTKQLEEYDIERLESQIDNQIKISALEDQLVIANAAVAKLRDNIDKMKEAMDQDTALRTLSSQLHESANVQVSELQETNEDLSRNNEKLKNMYNYLKQVLYTKDKTFDDLRNQLMDLRQQLNDEQRLREDTETALAAGDSEVNRLRNIINLLNDEKEKLYEEVENLMKASNVAKLKNRIKTLEKENAFLAQEVDKLTAYLEVVLPGYVDPEELALLKTQLEELRFVAKNHKKEVDDEKKKRLALTMQFQKEQQEAADRIKELKQDIAELRLKRKPNRQSVILLEKQKIGDDFCYRYYGGAEGKAKTQPERKVEPVLRQSAIDTKDPETTRRLKAELVAKDDESHELHKRLTELNLELARLRKVEDQYKNLKSEDDTSEDHVQPMKKAVSFTNRTIDDVKALKQENQRLQEVIKQIGRQSKTSLPWMIEIPMKAPSKTEVEKQRLADYEAKLTTCEIRRDGLKQKVEELQKENEKLKQDLADGHLADSDGKCKKCETEGVSLKQRVEELEKENERLKQNLVDEQLADSDGKFKKCETEGVSLKRRVEELEKENERLKQDLADDTGKEMDQNTRDWQDQVTERIEDLLKKVQELGAGSDPFVDVLEDLKKLLQDHDVDEKKTIISNGVQDKHIQELKSQLQALARENEELKEKIADLVRILDEVKKKEVSDEDGDAIVEKLQEKLKHCEVSNSRLKQEAEQLRNKLNEIGSLPELEDTLQKYKDENEFLRNEFTNLRHKIGYNDDKDKRIQELEEQLTNWAENYDAQMDQLNKELDVAALKENVTGDCTTHTALIRELELNLNNYRNTNENLEKRNAELESENDRLNQILERFQDDTHTGGALMDIDEESRMQDLVQHLNKLQKKNAALKTKNVQLELDNGRLKNDLEKLIGNEHKVFEKEMQRLSDLEKQMAKCQDKSQKQKKRLMKLEIENKKLKQDYINTLIEKEKEVLRGQEQYKRLRETGKLLRKTQEKKHGLSSQVVQLEVENSTLKQQVDSAIDGQLQEHLEKIGSEDLLELNKMLQEENERLKELIEKSATIPEPEKSLAELVATQRKNGEPSRIRLIQVELENQSLKRELEAMRSKDAESISSDMVEEQLAENILRPEEQNIRMRVVELEIENEYLKKELDGREAMGSQNAHAEKKINDLEEEVQKLTQANQDMKRLTVELELDNEYMRREMGRISKVHGSLEGFESDLDIQVHALKLKVDSLDLENKNLKMRLENMSQEKISLEAHTLNKLVKEIQRLMREFQDIKDSVPNRTSSRSQNNVRSIEDVENRLRLWKEKYETQLMDMKRDVDRLSGKGSAKVKTETKIRTYQANIDELENENKNMKIALEILLKEKGIMSNVKLVKEVQAQLAKYKDTESLRQQARKGSETVINLQEQLRECQETNEILRTEQVSLERHVQDRKIKELETQIRQSRTHDLPRTLTKEKLPSLLDLDLTRIRDLEEQLQFLHESKEEVKTDLENLRTEKNTMLNELTSQLQNCQTRKSELQSELERYLKINNLQRQRIKDLEDALKQANDGKKDLSKKVNFSSTSQGKMDVLELQYESLTKEYEKIVKICDEYKKRVVELEDQLRRCQEMNRRLRKKIGRGQARDGRAISEDSLPEQPSKDSSKFSNYSDATEDEVKTDEQLQKASEEPEDGQLREENDFFGREAKGDSSRLSSEIGLAEEEVKISESEQQLQESQKDVEELTSKSEEFRRVEKKLVEKESRIESLREQNEFLRSEVQKVSELEQRLRETRTNYRMAKRELDNIQNDKKFGSIRKLEKKIAELQKQLQQSLINNEKDGAKLERLEKEIASKKFLDEENKFLKNQVNTLSKQLMLLEEDNKNLKDQVNTPQSLIYKETISAKVKCLGDLSSEEETVSKVFIEEENKLLKDEINTLSKQLKSMEEENKNLKDQLNKLTQERDKLLLETYDQRLEIERLQDQVQLLGGGEISIFEQLSQKHGENEELKFVISQLQSQVDFLKCEREFGDAEEESRRSEESLKYHHNEEANVQLEEEKIEDGKELVDEDRTSYTKRIKQLEERVEKCQLQSEKLSQAARELEEETESLRQSLAERRENIPPGQRISGKETRTNIKTKSEMNFEKLENELRQQKEKWQSVVAKLTEQYEENIRLLKKQTESGVVPQPWMMQPPMVPVVWQPTMITYGGFVPPEKKPDAGEESVQKIADFMEKVQQTLDKSKIVLEKEVSGDQSGRVLGEEEKEQQIVDLESCGANVESEEGTVNVAELTKQLLRSDKMSTKIDKLPTDTPQAIEELKEVCVKQKVLEIENSMNKPETPGSSKESQSKKPEFKNVFSRRTDSASLATVSSKTQKKGRKKSPPSPTQRPLRKEDSQSFTSKKK